MNLGLLKRGSRGPQVKSLQIKLNSVISNLRLTPDGIFGSRTESAVKAFQTKSRIPSDGIVGSATRNRLEAAAARASKRSSLRSGSRGADVAKLQRLLNLKSSKGPKLVADGVFGQKTLKAVQNYQVHAGLKVDGVAGPQTMSSLENAPNAPRNMIDPPANPSPNRPSPGTPGSSTERPYYSGIVEAYGDPEDSGYFERINLPFTLHYGSQPVRSTLVHKKVAQSLHTALTQVLSHYGLEQIEALRINHNYGGLVNKRRMRNGSKWSTHSWGVAIDLNHLENKLLWTAERALFAKPEYKALLDIFESNGWYNLGRYKNFDFMHFQAVKV